MTIDVDEIISYNTRDNKEFGGVERADSSINLDTHVISNSRFVYFKLRFGKNEALPYFVSWIFGY